MRRWLAVLILSLVVVPVGAQERPPTPTAGETAAQFYMRYRATLLTARTVDDLSDFWSDGLRSELKALNIPNASTDIRSLQRACPTLDVKVVRTVPMNKSSVRLFLEGTSQVHGTKGAGSVVVTQENGMWKVAEMEGWTFQG
jgi:hypothetical protein